MGRPVSYSRLFRVDEHDPSYKYFASVEELMEHFLPVVQAQKNTLCFKVDKKGWDNSPKRVRQLIRAIEKAKAWCLNHPKVHFEQATPARQKLGLHFQDNTNDKVQPILDQVSNILEDLEKMRFFEDMDEFYATAAENEL